MDYDQALQSLLRPAPECIHDGERSTMQSYHAPIQWRHVRCVECGVLLWTERLNTYTHERSETTEDFVYELLYTKKGRTRILLAALLDSGWPIPEHWTKP